MKVYFKNFCKNLKIYFQNISGGAVESGNSVATVYIIVCSMGRENSAAYPLDTMRQFPRIGNAIPDSREFTNIENHEAPRQRRDTHLTLSPFVNCQSL